MSLRWLGVSFAFASALAAQPAAAKQDVACPEGQAIRAIDDKTAVCVPVPPPVNLAPLNAAISAETAARAAGDAALQGAINAEAVARMAADQELRDSIGAETGLRGRYSFTGTAVCFSSSTGFRTDFELVPLILPPPPPPATGTSTMLTVSSNSISGVRTFNGDGTGHVVFTVHTINYPAQVFGGVSFSTGGASVSTLEANFTYVVNSDRTIVIDDEPTAGVIIKGGNRVGWGVLSLNVPRFVGYISKDWRTIQVMQEDMVVEQSVLNSPPGVTPVQQFVTDRVCHRERTLHKIHD
ncbi:MAG TPA: hypothetical protein VN929_01825 [Burkholderiales bacterium]|nr:hypothetical protein [Burkholderiales bacterium]